MDTITTLAVAGYRSLRDVRFELGPLTVVTGPNGSGKSSLYRAVRLLADVAQGQVVPSLAQEGGLSSALWAGPEIFSVANKRGEQPVQGTKRREPVSLGLGVSSAEQGYAIDLGLPSPGSRFFARDPEIKTESLWTGRTWRRGAAFAERHGPAVQVRDGRGAWRQFGRPLATYDSMLTHCAGGGETMDLLLFRESLRLWRFYDHFRTDTGAPARQRQVGTRTPVLASDGADLAAAIATIMDVGADDELAGAIEDAFPGTTLAVAVNDGAFEIEVRQHGLLRPLRAAELSDGTLRYLLLIAALLTPPAAADGVQRAGDQPASRPDRAARPSPGARRGALADPGDLARVRPGRGAGRRRRRRRGPPQGARRDRDVAVGRACLGLAVSMRVAAKPASDALSSSNVGADP